ncbi:unnamed protein product [Orchesella dallaii]|uniref:Odorant receptor n=1 Tax=Orchesella dallaii TaxID=48710 RepID=A0ABP1RJT3_9HEXA
MALTSAALRVHNVLETLTISSFTIHQTSFVVRQSKIKGLRLKSIHHSIKCFLGFIFIFSFIKVFCMLTYYGKKQRSIEELGIFAFIMTIVSIALPALWTVERHSNELCKVLTQRFKFRRLNPEKRSWKQRALFGEGFIYILGFIYVYIPIIISLLPLIRNYDPVQATLLFLYKVISGTTEIGTFARLSITLFACIFYPFISIHSAATVLLLLLFIIMVTEGVQQLSNELYGIHRNSKFSREIFQFRKCLRLYKILQIMTTLANQAVEEFVSIGVFMGMFSTASVSFIAIKLYSFLPPIFHLFFCLTALAAFLLYFFLISLAAVPNKNGKIFKEYWMKFLSFSNSSAFYRKQLKACLPIGYSMEPAVRYITAKTAPCIIDVIINFTVTFALLNDNA